MKSKTAPSILDKLAPLSEGHQLRNLLHDFNSAKSSGYLSLFPYLSAIRKTMHWVADEILLKSFEVDLLKEQGLTSSGEEQKESSLSQVFSLYRSQMRQIHNELTLLSLQKNSGKLRKQIKAWFQGSSNSWIWSRNWRHTSISRKKWQDSK